MKTETSKTLKACTFDNIQCLRLLKAGSAKCSCITHKPAGKTITGLGPGPMFHMIRYGSYTGILHRKKRKKEKFQTDADAGRAPYVETSKQLYIAV